MAEKMKELSEIKETKSFNEFAIRVFPRGLILIPMAFLGVIDSQYASGIAKTNKIREVEENQSIEHLKLDKSKIIGRMVSMSDNDPEPREKVVKKIS